MVFWCSSLSCRERGKSFSFDLVSSCILNLQVVTPEEHERIHGREFKNSNTSDYKHRHSSDSWDMEFPSETSTYYSYETTEVPTPIIGIILIITGVIIAFAGLFTSIHENTCFITLIIGGIFGYSGLMLLNS